MDYVLDRQDRQDDTYFLVKWAGQTHAHNSWEPLSAVLKQPNFEFLMSTATTEQHRNTVNGRRKGTQPQQQIKKINLGTLKLRMPCLKKEMANWVFGDRVQQVISRNHLLRKYKVRWGDGCESWEDEQELLARQPQRMIDFFEKQLRIPA